MMGVRNGGLGLPSPRNIAIPNLVLSLRRCLQYSIEGVWIGHNHKPVRLPSHISNLYRDWETSLLKPFRIFNHYRMDVATICVKPGVKGDQWEHFLHKSSLNTCRERIKHVASCRTYAYLEHAFNLEGDMVSLNMIPELLDSKLVQGLLDMSRSNPKNRYKNDLFGINLKRKLRLDIWPGNSAIVCPLCKKAMDRKGDHFFRCKRISKTPMHDQWRDGLRALMQEILPLVSLIRSKTTVRDKQRGLVRKLKNTRVRPADISFRVDHSLGKSHWRTPIQTLLFDVTNSNLVVNNPGSYYQKMLELN